MGDHWTLDTGLLDVIHFFNKEKYNGALNQWIDMSHWSREITNRNLNPLGLFLLSGKIQRKLKVWHGQWIGAVAPFADLPQGLSMREDKYLSLAANFLTNLLGEVSSYELASLRSRIDLPSPFEESATAFIHRHGGGPSPSFTHRTLALEDIVNIARGIHGINKFWTERNYFRLGEIDRDLTRYSELAMLGVDTNPLDVVIQAIDPLFKLGEELDPETRRAYFVKNPFISSQAFSYGSARHERIRDLTMNLPKGYPSLTSSMVRDFHERTAYQAYRKACQNWEEGKSIELILTDKSEWSGSFYAYYWPSGVMDFGMCPSSREPPILLADPWGWPGVSERISELSKEGNDSRIVETLTLLQKRIRERLGFKRAGYTCAYDLYGGDEHDDVLVVTPTRDTLLRLV